MTAPSPRSVLGHPVSGVVCASILFGTSGTARTFLPDDASNLTIAALRLVVGAVPLVAVVWFRHARRWPRPTISVIVAGVAMAVFQVLFFQSVTSNGVAVGTMITIGSSPIIALLLERLVTGSLVGDRVVAVLVAVAGLILLVMGSATSLGSSMSWTGVVSGLGAGGCYAGYTQLSKRIMSNGWGSSMVMAQTFLVAAVVLVPFLFGSSLGWSTGGSEMLAIIYLGVATIAVPYLLYAVSLAVLPSATVVTLTLIEPLTAMSLGALYLGESIRPMSWIGALAVLYGLVMTSKKSQVAV